MLPTVLSGVMGASLLANPQPTAPPVKAASALVMDADTGRILWGRNVDTARYPASTTKIMTAILFVEAVTPNEVLIAPPTVTQVKGSSLHLKPGEQVSAHDLLMGMMLRSANDACHTVAVTLAGSEAKFAAEMTRRARELGATNTTFLNPHGLPNENRPGGDTHLSTARDLALIARVAMSYPPIAEAARTPEVTIKRSMNQLDTLIKNTNRLLESDPSTLGIKTGTTRAAGRCFVGMNERAGVRLITVILKSPDWKVDQVGLVDWSYKQFQRRPLVSAQDVVGEATVTNGKAERVTLLATKTIEEVVSDHDVKQMRREFEVAPVTAPVRAGQPVGKLKLTLADGTQHQVDLVAAQDVEAHPANIAAWVVGSGGLTALGLVALARYRRPRRHGTRTLRYAQTPTRSR